MPANTGCTPMIKAVIASSSGRFLMVLLATVLPGAALACMIAEPPKMKVSDAARATDKQPPSKVVARIAEVKRGKAIALTSCGDMGQVVIQIVAAVDNQTTKSRLGYRVKLKGGELPRGLRLPHYPVLTDTKRRIHLHWPDGRGLLEKPPLSFELTVQAVDRAGNEGAVSAPLVVSER